MTDKNIEGKENVTVDFFPTSFIDLNIFNITCY